MAKNEKAAIAPAAGAGFAFKVKKRVVVPVLKLANNVAVFVGFTAAFDTFPIRTNRDPVDGISEPRIVRAKNLESGQDADIIIGHSLQQVFNDNYPDGAYVGKSFRIMRIGVKTEGGQGRRSRFNNEYEVDEIEVG